MIKSIDTFYNGNYFRSRLEARWAVFFEEAYIKYQYEPTGFDLGNGQRYLPDFFLPSLDSYAEVKPFYQSTVKPGNTLIPWVINHNDYSIKWLPFSEYQKLIILVDNPGQWEPVQMRPDLFIYKEHHVLAFVSELFKNGANIYKMEKASKKRFEHNCL